VISSRMRTWKHCRWSRPPLTSPEGSPSFPPGGAVFVAELTGHVVGYAYVLPSPDVDVPAETSELGSIYVTEEVAGTGVARALMDAAIERARAAGQGALTLWVRRENGRARRFYEKYGLQLMVASALVRTTSCRSRCTRFATECRSNRADPRLRADHALRPFWRLSIEPPGPDRGSAVPRARCRFRSEATSRPAWKWVASAGRGDATPPAILSTCPGSRQSDCGSGH
jgi:GNAT superfamily N-acetyltransferase